MRARFLISIKLRGLAREERGLAVASVVMITAVLLGLGSAAAIATISAQRGTVRDQDTKAAIAAADAGANLALLRQNRILTTDGFPCLVGGGLGQLVPGGPSADGWCPPQTGTVGAATYSYRVKPPTLWGVLNNKKRITVVSTGTSDDVSRRIAVTAVLPTGEAVFDGMGAVGLDDVTVQNNANVVAVAGSNLDVQLQNLARLCGDIQIGYGHTFAPEQSATWCPGYAQQEGFIALPPPDQADIPQNNDNGRFFSQDIGTRTPEWDPATRVLTLNGSDTVTLGGSNYSFCKLEMSGSSSLIIAAGATVRIYFDDPANCRIFANDPQPHEQLVVAGTAKINPTGGTSTSSGFYFVGNDERATSASFQGTAQVSNAFHLYGPRTDVVIGGTSDYLGAIASKTLRVGGNATLTWDPDANNLDIAVLPIWSKERYVECRGAIAPTGAEPNANC